MRKISGLLASLLTLAVLLAGCEKSGTDAAARGPVTVTIGCNISTPYGTLDPVHEDGTILWIIEQAMEGLVKPAALPGGGLTIAPSLAESWEISADGLVYTFHLKPGVKFADGTAVTPADWIWSLERARDTPESPWASYAEPIKNITAPNDTTLVIELKELYAPFLSMLAIHNFAVQSKARFDRLGADEYFKLPLGTGPYYFTGWGIHEYYRLEKNPYYHGSPPTVDVLLFNVVPDDNTRIMQLQAGDIDVCLSPPNNRIAELQADPDITVQMNDTTEQRYLNFNITKAPLNDARVRRALRSATNKDEIIKIALFGYGEPTYMVFPRVIGQFFNSDVVDEGFNLDRAKALLAEAGYPNGFSLSFSYATGNAMYDSIGTILKEQWARAGVILNLNTMESAAVSPLFQALNHEMVSLRWSEDTNDPAGFADFIAVYDQSHGFHTGFRNARVTELTRLAAGTVDTARRAAAYKEIQKILYDECPMFPLFQVKYLLATRKNITGFNQEPLGQYDLTELAKK
jgi:peptide/nickel transport system substrate-binding protein